MESVFMDNQLYFGAAYYPEHWDETRWAEDIRLMKAAGFTVVRMGEFAWSTFEPREGEFHFDWLERAIDLLAANGIVTVLGTPTAAPPAWLTQAYPATLALDEHGQRREHGQRCHYCVNSPDYHRLSSVIVEKMAAHFGKNPHV
ncbi:MAG: beta-galactosidase, partial [Chloroflexi bacterium]